MPGLTNAGATSSSAARANGAPTTAISNGFATSRAAGIGAGNNESGQVGRNYIDTVTFSIARAIDDEISTTDDLLLEVIQHVIADLDNQASVFLDAGKVREYFTLKDARNNLNKLSLLTQVLRSQTRSNVAAKLLDLEARNDGRAA